MRSLRIFVTVGTHEQPFDRLLEIARVCAASVDGSEWVVQAGEATVGASWAKISAAYFPHEEIVEWNHWANVVMCHASPGSVFDALRAHSQPIVVARRHAMGEHVNDHQAAFAERLEGLGLAWSVSSDTDAVAALRKASVEDRAVQRSRLEQVMRSSQTRTDEFVLRFRQAMVALASDGAVPTRLG